MTRPRPSRAVPLDPVEFFQVAFGKEPHEWQVPYLRETRNGVLLKGRQVGASTAAASLALHMAMTRPGSLAAIVSPSLRQSTEIAQKARLGAWEIGEKMVQDSTSLLRFGNGSRVLSLPGTARSVRGYACDLLILDESAWIDDATWDAARPTTSASGGRTLIQSTPDLPSGFFYELWNAQEDGWARWLVRSDQVLDAESLERERAGMRPALYAQEYLCEFGTGGATALWTAEDWDALMVKGDDYARR